MVRRRKAQARSASIARKSRRPTALSRGLARCCDLRCCSQRWRSTFLACCAYRLCFGRAPSSRSSADRHSMAVKRDAADSDTTTAKSAAERLESRYAARAARRTRLRCAALPRTCDTSRHAMLLRALFTGAAAACPAVDQCARPASRAAPARGAACTDARARAPPGSRRAGRGARACTLTQRSAEHSANARPSRSSMSRQRARARWLSRRASLRANAPLSARMVCRCAPH